MLANALGRSSLLCVLVCVLKHRSLLWMLMRALTHLFPLIQTRTRSFVGHSLGNIVIRTALTRPAMAPLLPRMHTYISLAGPHLGSHHAASPLVYTGVCISVRADGRTCA